MDIRIILNGKKAGLEPVRSAIFKARETGKVDVRATWEGGDVERLVHEAVHDGCQRVVAAGGEHETIECLVAALVGHLENAAGVRAGHPAHVCVGHVGAGASRGPQLVGREPGDIDQLLGSV